MEPPRPDPWPSSTQWELLAPDLLTRERLVQDLYFREGWGETVAALGPDPVVPLLDVAVLAFKPEAIAARRVRPTLDHLRAHGFQALAAVAFRFNRHSMREVWRYDWTVYPNSRLSFSTTWYEAAETVLILFKDKALEAGRSASLRLASLKGSAIAAERAADSLRTVLDPPNQVLNFVHVADTPGEIVRELGILLDRDERTALLEVIAGGAVPFTMNPDRIIDKLEARQAPHDLDFGRAIERLKEALPEAREQLDELVARHSSGDFVGWDEICSAIPLEDLRIAPWDRICVASHLIERERQWAAADQA